MAVEVFAADEQNDLPVDTLRWVRLAEAVLADEGVRSDTELSILFVDETSISDLNKRFLGKEGPTDVLAFPIDEEPSESGRSPDSGGSGPGFTGEPEEVPTLLGDVVICPKVAERNAPDHAGTYDDEMALLIVHGVLHLLGMDHMDDEEAAEMERRETELLVRHYGVEPGSKLARLHEADAAASAPDAATTADGPATDGSSAVAQEAPAQDHADTADDQAAPEGGEAETAHDQAPAAEDGPPADEPPAKGGGKTKGTGPSRRPDVDGHGGIP
jgi:probable rRNA maturation factor